MNHAAAESMLLDIAAESKFSFQAWENKKFAVMKMASTTEKGNIGEDLLASLLREIGYREVAVLEGRRGDYDVAVEWQKAEVKFEVKVATRDVNGHFQFNGIRFDTRYTHLFCLGVSPEETRYLIVPKSWLNNKEGFNMAPMAKGANASFKLTKPLDGLNRFDGFKQDVDAIFQRGL